MNLPEFLMKAKRKTFASNFSFPKKIEGNKMEYQFSDGSYLYLDQYSGSIVDEGEEKVFLDDELVWSMQYQGGMTQGNEGHARRCFNFLKQSLRNMPEDFPVRGPMEFRNGLFLYKNSWRGNLEEFNGNEHIFLDNKGIYSRSYSGGTQKH